MRTVDIGQLKQLYSPSKGLWRVGDDRLLRTLNGHRPMHAEAEARALFDVYRAAYDAGIGSPEPFEIVEVPGGYGVIVEFVQGIPLSLHLAVGSLSPAEVGQAMGQVMRRINAVQFHTGVDWNEDVRGWGRVLAAHLPPGQAKDAQSFLESIPRSQSLLHGDIHAANIIVDGGVLRLIDLEEVGYGHPMVELGISCAALMVSIPDRNNPGKLVPGFPEGVKRDVMQAMLRAYFPDMGDDVFEAVSLQAEVLGMMRSYQCSLQQVGECDSPNATTMDILDERAACIAELLPQVRRTWLPA